MIRLCLLGLLLALVGCSNSSGPVQPANPTAEQVKRFQEAQNQVENLERARRPQK